MGDQAARVNLRDIAVVEGFDDDDLIARVDKGLEEQEQALRGSWQAHGLQSTHSNGTLSGERAAHVGGRGSSAGDGQLMWVKACLT